jgi:putative endonuclease
MTESKRNLGRYGEAKAAEYLENCGYTVVDRNARTSYGEIDIVACKGSLTVFVEVKTRRNRTFGYPEESVTASKQARMLHSAQAYLMAHPELDGDWQIDVVAIEMVARDFYQVVHFPNAICG